MAIKVYPFHKISDEIHRPWIPIRIYNAQDINSFIDLLSLLDTGADHCVFPKFVAEQCKFNLRTAALSTETMQGLAETKIEVWKHTFKMELWTPDRKELFWKSKEIVIGCVDHDNIPPILGFGNFMSNFKITFNHTTKKIFIDDKPSI